MLSNSCFLPRRDPTPLLQRMRENREEVNAIFGAGVADRCCSRCK